MRSWELWIVAAWVGLLVLAALVTRVVVAGVRLRRARRDALALRVPPPEPPAGG